MNKPEVKLIAYTPNPELIVACAAKLCYSDVGMEDLLKKQTPEGVEKFLNMLISMGHESPLEHINFTFGVENISRACSHQLVRHRLASYSQQSQRYVNLEKTFKYITPKEIDKYANVKNRYDNLMNHIFEEYVAISHDLLVEYIYEFLSNNKIVFEQDIRSDIEHMKEYMKENHKRKYNSLVKLAIENARYVLPNSCETKIVFTMNARTLLNFLEHRTCNRAQEEIQMMALEMQKHLMSVAPIIFRKSGASCIRGNCKEGSMCCGKPFAKVN